jgi:hypothetical protein
MPQHRIRRAIAACSILCLLAVQTNVGASAADLDSPWVPKRQRAELWPGDRGEFVPAHHGCRLMPEPQLNMWGEATLYQPTWVCVSRGLYADTFPPRRPPKQGWFGLW